MWTSDHLPSLENTHETIVRVFDVSANTPDHTARRSVFCVNILDESGDCLNANDCIHKSQQKNELSALLLFRRKTVDNFR